MSYIEPPMMGFERLYVHRNALNEPLDDVHAIMSGSPKCKYYTVEEDGNLNSRLGLF